MKRILAMSAAALMTWGLGCGDGQGAADPAGDADAVDGPGADLADGADADAPGDEGPGADVPADTAPDVALVEDLLARGVEALGKYAPDLARDRFIEAASFAPADPRPRYGLVLADVQKGWQLLDLIVSEVAPPAEVTQETPPAQAGGASAAPGFHVDALTARQPLSEFLAEVAFGMTDLGERQIARIDELLVMPGTPELVVPSLPLHLGTLPFIELQGRWDRADLYWIRSGQQLVTALFLLLRAHDLQANLLEAFSINSLDLRALLAALPEVMEAAPGFLGTRPATGDGDGGGAADVVRLRQLVIGAGRDAREARQLMEDEDGDRSQDVFRIGPTMEKDGAVITSTIVRAAGRKGDHAVVLWSGAHLSVESFFDAFGKGAAGEADHRLSLSRHVVPVLGVLADVVRQSAGLVNVAGLFGASLGAFGDVVQNLDDLDAETPETVPALVSDLVGSLLLPADLVEIDLGPLLFRPVPLRDVLPATRATEPWGWDLRYDCPVFGALSAVPGPDGTPAVGLLDLDGELTAASGPSPVCFRTRSAEGGVGDEECVAMESAGTGRYEAAVAVRDVEARAAIVAGDGWLDRVAGSADVVEAAYVDPACEGAPEVRITWAGGATDRLLDAFSRCWDAPTCDRPHRFPGVRVLSDPPAALAWKDYPDLPADGWASPEPYRAWRSPSWNGAFWVDLTKLKTAAGAPPPEVLGEPGLRLLDAEGANLFFTFFPKLLGL